VLHTSWTVRFGLWEGVSLRALLSVRAAIGAAPEPSISEWFLYAAEVVKEVFDGAIRAEGDVVWLRSVDGFVYYVWMGMSAGIFLAAIMLVGCA